jgi:FKBP-type peptidyl-prolyl cis-trans isomerase
MDVFRRQSGLKTAGEPETLTFARDLGVELSKMTKTESGLYYTDRKVGDGPVATVGKIVKVGYVGRLANGDVFDRSGPGQPIEFELGAGQVILGWDEGIQGMNVGGRRLLVIRPGLAYGNMSPGAGIPANATLVFDVTLDGVTQ